METSTSVDGVVVEDGFSLETDTPDVDGSTTSRDNDSEDGGQQGSDPKKPRIVYDKNFLMECFFLPRSRQKPVDFPLPNLGCTLGSMKSVGSSPFTYPPPYVPPTKRKEENGRRERERDPDDNISLRPHSGNFSGGCGPNLPIGSRERDGMNVGLQQIIDDFRDNHQRSSTNLRFTNNKRFELVGDRNIRDRERDMDRGPRERDIMDRGPRERDIMMDRGPRERDRDRSERDQPRNERDQPRSERDQPRNERDQPRNERDRDRGERERDRERVVRERDRDLRDSRDRIGRNGESNHFNPRRPPTHTQGAWSVDVPERESDWNRRRNRNGSGGTSTRDAKEKGGYYERRGHYHREREEEQEPEWFSGGPSSQHETIELRGFTDDERRDKFKSKDTSYGRDNPSKPMMNGSTKASTVSKVVEQEIQREREFEEAGSMDFSLEKILKMEHIPGILPNGLLEDEEPSGRSKFSQIFQRNSANNVPKEDNTGKQLLNTLNEARAATANSANLIVETESKKEIVEELGNALRSILLKPSQPKTEKVEQRKPVEQKKTMEQPPPRPRIANAQSQPQPPKPEKMPTGINMLQMLLEKMIEPGSKSESGRSSVEVGEPIGFGPPPGLKAPEPKQPTNVLAQIINTGMHNVGPNRHPQFIPPSEHPEMGRPFNAPMEEEKWNLLTPMKVIPPQPQPMQVNPFQVFEGLIKQQHPPNTPRDIMAPQQVMAMLPPEIQYLIQHVDPTEEFWSQPDCRPLIGALTTGELSFRKLIQDLISPVHHRKPFLASMVQMILSGTVIVPSLTIIGQPLKFNKPQESQPVHRIQNHHQNQHEMSNQRPDDGGRDMMRRSGTPVSSMAFGMTPTSVMRKMTAEPTLPKPIGSPAINNSGSSQQPRTNAEFSFLVQQLTNHNAPPPSRSMIHPNSQEPMIHPIHYQSMHPRGHMMVPPQSSGMMIHPNYGLIPSQPVMNISHHEMPQS